MKGYKQKEKSPPSFQVKLLDKSGCISANEQVLCFRFALILKLLKSFYGFTVFYGTVGLALFLLFLVL